MKNKKGKWIILVVVISIVLLVANWARRYYDDRYVQSDVYYTQIPLDQKNDKTEWIKDNNGKNAEKGKQYELIGYNDKGESREVQFSKKGEAKDYYSPGIYIKASTSKTLVIGISVVDEKEVPKQALEKIKSNGTRK
ncbi:YxeA family protein [Helcococcus ovis]|uniref:YxeA family protein n=1 Tax=Helcococcus ovis TaxID=72026 RepID=UPI0038B9DDB6